MLVDKRMPAGKDMDQAVVVQRRSHGLIFACELTFCKNHIHIDDDFVRPGYVVRASPNDFGKIAQYALDFHLLVDEFDFQFVVEFHNLHRFYKKR